MMKHEADQMRWARAAGRRLFLRQSVVAAAGLTALPTALLGCSRAGERAAAANGGTGEPAKLSWNTRIGTDAEPGPPLTVSGTIYAADGRTPLEGAVLHVYHTDARGIYSDAEGDPRTLARLRGRMLTGRDGRYEFRTIRPASYPGNTIRAHIHVAVKAPGGAEQWITDYWFDDDPLLPASERERHIAAGAFSPVMRITRDASGAQRGTRDIRVG
jgi:protocatechuate 3,4-dioxygenase, beta subunit